MRFTWAVLLLLAGCYGESIDPGELPLEEPESHDTSLDVDPKAYEELKTSELDTHLVRPIAKTIDWAEISTTEGTPYVVGSVVVDRVLREDVKNVYGVRLRLKNRTPSQLSLEYIIRFHTRSGAQLAAYNGYIGNEERWRPIVIEPYGSLQVGDFCRVIGAEGFRLFVRIAGTEDSGEPQDVPKDVPGEEEDVVGPGTFDEK